MLKKLILVSFFLLFVTSASFSADAGKTATSSNPVVTMETTLGTIKIELFSKEAPITVNNFLEYVKSGFYTDTIFHRVIPGFMAQGGGFTQDRKEKPTRPPIKNEAGNGLKNDRGTIAMARTNNPDSASAQFFINVGNNNGLNRPSPDGFGYAVFGKVIDGMTVVDKIMSVKTKRINMVFENFPDPPVTINSVKLNK